MPRRTISLPEARRIALAAQGFGIVRPSCQVNAGHIRRTIDRLGLLQLDYVDVLAVAWIETIPTALGSRRLELTCNRDNDAPTEMESEMSSRL